jgi:hypothetical protein
MRGIEIGLNEVTPTIPSEKKIQVVGLKFPFRFLRKEISHKDDLIETDQGLTCCERTPPPLKKQGFVSQDPIGGFSTERECTKTYISIQYHDI